jgi:hypothetical protein
MRRAILFMASLAILKSGDVLADGGMFVPITYMRGEEKVSSDTQKALIAWHKGMETLHVQSSYRGPATDFAWVIPVPTRPEVNRSDWSLFEAAEQATRPHVTVRIVHRHTWLGTSAGMEGKETLSAGVRELESLDIRELHIDIVEANDAGDFVRWLRDHEYSVSEDSEPVLRQYIDERFYFVVARISKSSIWAKRKGVTETVSGGLTPLAITFSAEKPFYPLAISAISSAPTNELLLLTVAGKRLAPVEYGCTELKTSDVEYAVRQNMNRRGHRPFLTSGGVFTSAIEAAQARLGKPTLVVESVVKKAWEGENYTKLVEPQIFSIGRNVRVTRFHGILKPEEMKDITFVPAEKNKLFDGRFYIY